MLLELLLIGVLIFMALTFFYKQAICEFRLNQIEWSQNDKLSELFTERVPIVIRGRPPTAFWTQEDIVLRDTYSLVRIFEDRILSDWILQATPESACPWKLEHARLLGGRNVSGLNLWAERILNPLVYQANPLLKAWLRSVGSCWAGEKGLWKTIAPWTALFSTQGSVMLTIMTESAEVSLPPLWKDKFPSRLTPHDSPFIGDLKFMDIVLRPNNLIFIPAHWFVSWTSIPDEKDSICPMICSIEYHSPVSKFAEWSTSRT